MLQNAVEESKTYGNKKLCSKNLKTNKIFLWFDYLKIHMSIYKYVIGIKNLNRYVLVSHCHMLLSKREHIKC